MKSMENLMIERPVNSVDDKDKQLWNHGILMIMVIWRNCNIEKATWEIGEKMKTRISVLVWGYRKMNFEDKILKEGENCNIHDQKP